MMASISPFQEIIQFIKRNKIILQISFQVTLGCNLLWPLATWADYWLGHLHQHVLFSRRRLGLPAHWGCQSPSGLLARWRGCWEFWLEGGLGQLWHKRRGLDCPLHPISENFLWRKEARKGTFSHPPSSAWKKYPVYSAPHLHYTQLVLFILIVFWIISLHLAGEPSS